MAHHPRRLLRCLHSRTPLTLVVGLCLMLPAARVHALGFGQPLQAPVLGQPLNFTLPVHLAAGERFDADCVRAEVQVGDRHVPAYEVRLSVLQGSAGDERLLRVVTLGGVDEPLVAVQVDSACAQGLSRRFTLLSQPGSAAADLARTVAIHRSRAVVGASLTLDRSAVPRAGRTVMVAGLGAALAAVPRAGAGQAVRAATALPDVVAQAAVQVAGDQIKALEQQVQLALAEARRQQDVLGQLRQRLDASEAANRWLPWLLLGLVVTGAVALWLALRVRRLQAEHRRQAWSHPLAAPPGEAEVAPDGPVSLLSPGQPMLSRTGDGAGEGPGAATQPALAVAHPTIAAAAAAAASGRAGGGGPGSDFALGSGVPPRPVSVEELLDLDQQVDFFLVLGQEQAAVELLLSHVRSTGGTSALPYFKLLEIYHQLGDEEAYERTRERFNQRFNAQAPDWSGDLTAGLRLEDYPDVVQCLQRAWPQPLRAVAELESLLLRRADLEPFDMPAYREVLMLHALVRDLPAAPVAAAGALQPLLHADPPPPVDFRVDASEVDVLLPLDDNSQALDITEPRPRLADRASAQSLLAGWVFTRNAEFERSAGASTHAALTPDADLPSLKLDLDLNDFAPAPREFTRPAAFTDIDHRRDSRLSDLAAFDDSDLLPPSSITRH